MYNVYEHKMAIDVPMASDITTLPVKTARMFNYTVQYIWADGLTPIGEVFLEVSIDGKNWTKYTDTQLPVSGNADTHVIDVREPTHAFMRAVYNRTSGDGVMNILFCGKGW